MNTKLISFYLPQFHPIPENNEWWGEGFTEWTNVTKAQPRFEGHHQPHLPADLGFYDLRVPETRIKQAELAREYGVYGFCYYHYWFNGRRILERPFQEVFESGKPDLPFCLCWANENWTRVWDGGQDQVLLKQDYNKKDNLDHIRSLLPYFADDRYICVDGRPLFLVYRTSHLPNPQKTAETWREIAIAEGIGDLFLARVNTQYDLFDPSKHGFDASVDFAPDWTNIGPTLSQVRGGRTTRRFSLSSSGIHNNRVYMYDNLARSRLNKPDPDYLSFPCITPRWDNSARREQGATIFLDSTPAKYGAWLSNIIERMKKPSSSYGNSSRVIFVNAWNEWAEGAHLEPEQKWGRAYLEATRDVV